VILKTSLKKKKLDEYLAWMQRQLGKSDQFKNFSFFTEAF
jgi:hypothetical protein